MKKIPNRKRLFLIKWAQRKHLKELKRKKKRLRLKYKRNIENIKNRRANKFQKPTEIKYESLLAPKHFSLFKNPDVVVDYFDKAKRKLSTKKPIFIDVSNVEIMEPDTLTYLCALVTDTKFTSKTPFIGNSPKEPKLREMFKKSGFLDLMHHVNQERGKNEVSNNLIHFVSKTKVDNLLAGQISEEANMHTYGMRRTKLKSLHPILIECMANTKNHANYGETEEVYDWWLLAYHERESKITKFCFLDLGVGIFGSLESMYRDNNLGWLSSIFRPNNELNVLRDILEGTIVQSSTNKSERGLGLNHIYSLVKNDRSIRNFTLLSNKVIAHIGYNKVDIIEKVNCNFKGTLYYWELIPTYEAK